MIYLKQVKRETNKNSTYHTKEKTNMKKSITLCKTHTNTCMRRLNTSRGTRGTALTYVDLATRRELNDYKATLEEAKLADQGLFGTNIVKLDIDTMCYKCGNTMKAGRQAISGKVKITHTRKTGEKLTFCPDGYMCKECFSRHSMFVKDYSERLRKEVYQFEATL